MMRVTGAVAVVFAFGAGAMTVLGAWLGGSAEAASLGLVGAGLVATSYALGGRVGASTTSVTMSASADEPTREKAFPTSRA